MDNDDAYANTPHIPDGAAYPDRWAAAARAFRERGLIAERARLNQPYGPHPRNRFDLFYPAGRPEGLVVLIHGGFWLKFGREDFSHLARGVTEAGWACALPSYTLAPEARISAIGAEIVGAITTAAALIAGPIVLTGHSVGGHLAARMLCEDITLPVRDRLAACVPVSPLADLRPLLATAMNNDLRLDPAEVAAETLTLHRPQPGVPVTVIVGAAERPAFLNQARWLAQAWHVPLRVAPERHHFDVVEDFEDAGSDLVKTLTRTT